MIFASKRNFVCIFSKRKRSHQSEKVFNFVSFSEWFELFSFYFAYSRMLKVYFHSYSVFFLLLFYLKRNFERNSREHVLWIPAFRSLHELLDLQKMLLRNIKVMWKICWNNDIKIENSCGIKAKKMTMFNYRLATGLIPVYKAQSIFNYFLFFYSLILWFRVLYSLVMPKWTSVHTNWRTLAQISSLDYFFIL